MKSLKHRDNVFGCVKFGAFPSTAICCCSCSGCLLCIVTSRLLFVFSFFFMSPFCQPNLFSILYWNDKRKDSVTIGQRTIWVYGRGNTERNIHQEFMLEPVCFWFSYLKTVCQVKTTIASKCRTGKQLRLAVQQWINLFHWITIPVESPLSECAVSSLVDITTSHREWPPPKLRPQFLHEQAQLGLKKTDILRQARFSEAARLGPKKEQTEKNIF